MKFTPPRAKSSSIRLNAVNFPQQRLKETKKRTLTCPAENFCKKKNKTNMTSMPNTAYEFLNLSTVKLRKNPRLARVTQKQTLLSPKLCRSMVLSRQEDTSKKRRGVSQALFFRQHDGVVSEQKQSQRDIEKSPQTCVTEEQRAMKALSMQAVMCFKFEKAMIKFEQRVDDLLKSLNRKVATARKHVRSLGSPSQLKDAHGELCFVGRVVTPSAPVAEDLLERPTYYNESLTRSAADLPKYHALVRCRPINGNVALHKQVPEFIPGCQVK